MATTSIRNLSYEDFPIKLFWRLLKRPDEVAVRVIGNEKKWENFKMKWDNDHSSLESEQNLEQQKKVSLAFIQGQKASLTLKWLMLTDQDPKPVIEELGYKWHDDPLEMKAYLEKQLNKSINKYELESAALKQIKKPDDEEGSNFTIDEAIASLDIMGFTVDDHNTLTIGKYNAMSKVANIRINSTKKEV